MLEDIIVQEGVVIPAHEIEVTASTSGGPGGQHVNRAQTRITLRWNVRTSGALTDVQKEQLLNTLGSYITDEGDIIVHAAQSRSQETNKVYACQRLAELVAQGLHVPKERVPTKPTPRAREARLEHKTKRGMQKRLRTKKIIPEE